MTGKPDDTGQPASDPGTKEEERIASVAELQQRQQATDSKVDRILSILGDRGEHTQAHETAQDKVEDRLDRPGRIQEEMATAIRSVRAEERAEEDRRQHAAEHERMRQPPQETQPREAAVKGKARMQRILFGGD